MTIKSCLIVSISLIFNTQMNSNADVTGPKTFLSQSLSNFQQSGIIQMPPIFFNENKRATYRDIKNHNDRKTRHQVSTVKPLNKPRILAKIPSLHLEPPGVAKHYWNDKFKKNSSRGKSKKNLMTKNISPGKNHGEIYPNYIRDHAPLLQNQQEVQETKNEKIKNDEETNFENSDNKNRVDFHVHGHQGPDSYVFGFDAGIGKNRQFRFEEKHENGTVTGHYGYYDARGKLRKTYYTSDPATGFEEITNGHSSGQ